MELKQIEYFLQLARFGHVSQTADFLDISQPTLSKSISSLERDLDVQLFDRVGNRLKLNDNGVKFQEYARLAMQYLSNGIIATQQTRYETSGTISIFCMSYASILLPCINEYAIMNPYTNFSVMINTHESDNMGAEIQHDLVLTSALGELPMLNDQFWVPQPLFREKGCLAVAPLHPLYSKLGEDGDTIDPALVKNEQFIGMKRANTTFDSSKTPFSKNFNGTSRTYLQTDDFVARIHALQAGIGVALLPESCISDAKCLCPGLKCFPLNDPSSERTVILMRKKRSLLSEAALDFWNFVLEYYNLPRDDRP